MIHSLYTNTIGVRGFFVFTLDVAPLHLTGVRFKTLPLCFQALAALNAPHVHLPAMETLESDALLYVAYAQTLCSVSTKEQDDLDRSVNSHATGRTMYVCRRALDYLYHRHYSKIVLTFFRFAAH